MKSLIWIFIGLLLATSQGANNSTQFVPTDEWQEIQEGQAIQQGLHVRINLQTGKKEAKLLDKEENEDQPSSLSTVPGANVQDHDEPSSMDKLKEALKGIPGDDFKLNEEELKRVDGKYRSYDEIKQELKDANLEVKSDSDIMNALLKRFEDIHKFKDLAKSAVKDEVEVIFEDMEYLVHQIDNAIDFIDRQGIEKIIWPSLNQTDSSLKIHALKLLGTVVQNNPKAKIALFERNGGGVLLSILSQSTNSGEISAGLYVFGALVRKFPYAQANLLNPHGYSLLFGILNKKVDLQVQIKIVKLIADLVQDYENAVEGNDVDPKTKEQYESTSLKERLLKVEYCKQAGEFFNQAKAELVHDEVLTDEVVNALRSVRKGLCHDTWSTCALFRHTLLVLRNNLGTRIDDWSGGKAGVEYLREIQHVIDQFVEELYGKAKRKDEL